MNSKLNKNILLHIMRSPDVPKIFVDLEAVDNRFKWIKSKAPKNLDFLFPVKSLPHSKFLSAIEKHLIGFELSNELEFELIKDFLSDDSQILLSNSNHNTDFISQYKSQVHFDISYLQQLEQSDLFENLSLRLKPPLDLNQGKNTRFGLELDELKQVVTHPCSAKVKSLHFHLGFEKNSFADLTAAIDYALSIKNDYFKNVELLNIGGGITPLSEADLDNLFEKISKLPIKIIIEAGRFFTEQCCHAIGKVIFCRTRSDGTSDVVLNISRECHLKWTWPKKFNVVHMNKNSSVELAGNLKVSGLTSYEGDLILAASIPDKLKVAPGDYMVFDNVSGYSIAWNKGFNGLPEAEVIFI